MNAEVVAGLKYAHVVRRKKIVVERRAEMLGSYGPGAVHERVLPAEEAPKGMLGRGEYSIKSRLVDDDGHVWMERAWKMRISKK